MASSSVIGALRVNLGLDSAQFQNGLRRGQTDMQRFAARARVAATAAAASFAAAAGGLTALTMASARSAKEIERLSQVANAAPAEFQRWAAASKDVGIEQEKLSDILKDVNDRVGDFVTTGGGPMADFFENIAPRVGVTADQFKKLSGPQALQLYVDTLQRAGVSQQEMTFYMEAMASDATALIPLLRDGGREMERLGNNAASLGAIMSGSTVAALSQFDENLQDVRLAMTGIGNRIAAEVVPMLNAMTEAFVNALREGGALRVGLDLLIDNISLIASTAAAFVAFMGARWVGAMVIATASTASLSGALTLLRTAIMRTGFGALIIGAGVLVDWFAKLVVATGGFGNALAAMKDVALEVFERIKLGFQIIPAAVAAGATQMAASFHFHLTEMAVAFARFTQGVADGMNSLFGTNLSGLSVETGFVGQMQDADAAMQGLVTTSQSKLRDLAGEISAPLESLSALKEMIGDTGEGLTGASQSAREMANSLSNIPGVGGGGGSNGGSGGGGLPDLADDVEDVAGRFDALKDASKSAFVAILDGSKSAKQGLSDLLASFANMALSSTFDNLWASAFGGGPTGGAGKGLLDGLLSFDGGGSTHRGPRSGGMDGKGGFLAMLHPNETVIDHTRGGMGSVSPVINFNIDAKGADPAAIQRLEGAMQRAEVNFSNRVVTAVTNAQKRRQL